MPITPLLDKRETLDLAIPLAFIIGTVSRRPAGDTIPAAAAADASNTMVDAVTLGLTSRKLMPLSGERWLDELVGRAGEPPLLMVGTGVRSISGSTTGLGLHGVTVSCRPARISSWAPVRGRSVGYA